MKPDSNLYFDKNSEPIDRSCWNSLFNDPFYKVVREYQNDQVWMSLIWMGVISDQEKINLLPEYYPLFKLYVKNCLDDAWVHDPIENGKTFSTIEKANAHIDKFLEKYTHCHWNKGKFVELDNKLTPPPPPDPDLPSEKEIAGLTDSFGAW